MPDICDQSVIKKRADSVQKSLNDFKEIQIGTSIGIALYPENGTEYESLFNKADEAMYYSKTHVKSGTYITKIENIKKVLCVHYIKNVCRGFF